MDRLKQDIEEWVLQFVSVHNSTLGAIPCPFAKEAILTSKIEYIEFSNAYEHISNHDYLIAICENITYHWPKNKEIAIIGCDPMLVSVKELSSAADIANNKFLRKRGYVVLEDHPNDEEIISNVVMNQGSWALLLVQSLDKLNNASNKLRKQGYYDSWSKENIDSVVSWRLDG